MIPQNETRRLEIRRNGIEPQVLGLLMSNITQTNAYIRTYQCNKVGMSSLP